MRYSLRTRATHNTQTKTKVSHFAIAFVIAFASISAVIPLALSNNTQAAVTYRNSFERPTDTNTTEWDSFPAGNTITVQPAGTITPTHGNYYATIDGPMYTKWGGYSGTFPEYGYTTSIDVYLDPAEADGIDKRFDFSSAINNQSTTHLRDFIFHIGTVAGQPGSWRANVSNNAPGDPSAANYQDLTGGWYTLESNFHNDGSGNLAVRMTISGAETRYWDMGTSDVIATNVGGNRYGWFTTQQFTELAIDNARLSVNPAPTRVYVDDNYTFSGSNDGHLYGYDAFDTIEAGLAAVAANGTVHVYDGTYSNVVLDETYSDNVLVKGHGRPDINGLDLSESTFNGLTFERFDFLGDSAGYGNFSFTIDADGNYEDLAIVNSRFDGDNTAGRGAIFLNRGFEGFTLDNNTFKRFKNSSGVYSLVFTEAQGAALGNNFVATNNTFTNNTSTNSIETYRWKNVTISTNTVSGDKGRVLVWSNDSESLENVTINGNNLTLTAGVGIGAYYMPGTTVTINGNTVDGADTCLKVDSVSDVSVTNNVFTNCSTTDFAFGATQSTQPNSVTVTGNQFSGDPAITNSSSFALDASKNWWGSNANPSDKTSGQVATSPWCEQAACTSFTDGTVTPTPTPTPEQEPNNNSSNGGTTTVSSGTQTAGQASGVSSTSSSTNVATVEETVAQVLGTESGIAANNTTGNPEENNTTESQDENSDSGRFLGLGWWWILVLSGVGLLAYYWFVVRKADQA